MMSPYLYAAGAIFVGCYVGGLVYWGWLIGSESVKSIKYAWSGEVSMSLLRLVALSLVITVLTAVTVLLWPALLMLAHLSHRPLMRP